MEWKEEFALRVLDVSELYFLTIKYRTRWVNMSVAYQYPQALRLFNGLLSHGYAPIPGAELIFSIILRFLFLSAWGIKIRLAKNECVSKCLQLFRRDDEFSYSFLKSSSS